MNDKIKVIFKTYEKKLVLSIIDSSSVLYFLLMLRFYLIDYYVPDFRLYGNMAVAGYMAKDGFSSLFLFISGLTRLMPKVITVICLVMLSISIFSILYFYVECFYTKLYNFIIVYIMVLSSGCWYYFYGKIYYDFPFSAFTFGIGLIIFAKIVKDYRNHINMQNKWNIFCMIMGLALSWKMYNIFLLAGLGLLVLCNDETRDILIECINTLKKVVVSIIAFMIGYLVGNYNLIISPIATLKGIRAYKASYSIKYFLLLKSRIIWDHVNDLPFNITVCNLFTLFILLVVLPIAMKKYRYLLVSIFMFACLALYITFFSPGYAWHGFTFGVFVILFLIFIIGDKRAFINEKLGFVLVLALVMQCAVNFAVYIPMQIRWYETTEEAIEVLEKKEDEIYDDVNDIILDIGESTFYIDEAIKRYRVLPTSELNFNKISYYQTYIVPNNVSLVNPLEWTDYYAWTEMYSNERYVNDANLAEYILFIIPDCFERMGDVANIHLYDEKEIYNEISGKGYRIYVYKN